MQLNIKSKIIMMMGMALIFVLIFCLYNIIIQNSVTKNDPFANLPPAHATWHWIAETPQELVESSDIISIGKVVDSYTRPVHNLVFTHNLIEIEHIYMLTSDYANAVFENGGELNNGKMIIDVVQTGGVYQDMVTVPFAEDPLYEIGEKYLFFLNKASEGYYLPTGAFQGCASIDNGFVQFADEYVEFPDLEVSLDKMVETLQKTVEDDLMLKKASKIAMGNQTRYIFNLENIEAKSFIENSFNSLSDK